MNIGFVVLLIIVSLACSLPAVAKENGEGNVALASQGAFAIASSEYGDQMAQNAIDGKWIGPGDSAESNRWHAAIDSLHPHWIWIRFKQPARISRIVIHRGDVVDYPVDFVCEYSQDGGKTVQPLFTVKDNTMSADQFTFERTLTPIVTDNVRIRILRSSHANPNYAQLSEIEVFGSFVSPQEAKSASKPTRIVEPVPVLKPTQASGVTQTNWGDVVEFRSKWLRLAVSRTEPKITSLCWDSLGESKVDTNLLSPGHDGGVTTSFNPLFPQPQHPLNCQMSIEGNLVRYVVRQADGTVRCWEIRVEAKSVRMAISTLFSTDTLVKRPTGVSFAFDLSNTSIAPLASPKPGSTAPLPCIIHASDFGSLLIESSSKGFILQGQPQRPLSRWNASVIEPAKMREDGLYVIPAGDSHLEMTLSVKAFSPLPNLTQGDSRLRSFPRHWLNTFQYRSDIGIMANNIVSDNAVFCMHTFTDPAVYTSTLPGGIEAIDLAKESLDRYFAGARGYGVGWEDMETETYPSLLISAWDVIRVTGDLKLLKKWLPKLESIAACMEKQDKNGDGLTESSKSGTRGDDPFPSSNWWDQINFGYQDAYTNALGYRAWLYLADLESLAGNTEKSASYLARADKIKSVYVKTFLNPKTGILVGWKDAQGELHDYWFVWVNAIAILQGLVPDDLANKIVDKIEAKMKEVGFSRFDLGLPGNLIPVPKNDYGRGALGSPQQDDGSDTFGVFENGGASACFAQHYIQALYKLGRRAEADRILWPMMRTYAAGGFQNGIPNGGEWRHWDGRASGYEGFLADAYYAQMCVFTGYHGIGFGPKGFYLEPWSPHKGKTIPLGLRFMGKIVNEVK